MANINKTLKEKLIASITHVEDQISKAKRSIKEKFDLFDPIKIMPYYGFGNDTYVFLKGRVLENEKVKEKSEGNSVFEHVRNTYKRYESDEIPGIKLKATYAGKEMEVETDDEGYFQIEFRFESPIDYNVHGNEIKLKLLETKTENDEIEATGYFFVPGKDAEYGVISDIDDTVLVSKITHYLGRLKLMLLKDATERSPFPGIAAFLRALCKGSDSRGRNPLFFVSGSEWNLFDLLINFFRFHGIPEGPLLLRDKGLSANEGTAEGKYKQVRIHHILDTYPDLKFICIGDSGQEDPEIYKEIVDKFPGRVLGIYIRDVSPEKRDKEVHKIADYVKGKGVEMVLVEDTLKAAEHALSMKWINKDQLTDIKEDCEADVE